MLYSILGDLARVFHCEICWIRTRDHCIRGFRESVKTVFIIFLVQKLYFIRFWTVKTVRQIVFKYCEENCEKNPCILYSSWLKADTVSAYSSPWPCGQYCIYRFCTHKMASTLSSSYCKTTVKSARKFVYTVNNSTKKIVYAVNKQNIKIWECEEYKQVLFNIRFIWRPDGIEM